MWSILFFFRKKFDITVNIVGNNNNNVKFMNKRFNINNEQESRHFRESLTNVYYLNINRNVNKQIFSRIIIYTHIQHMCKKLCKKTYVCSRYLLWITTVTLY